MVPFRVLYGVRTWLWSCWWFCCRYLFVQLFASRVLSRCKTWHGRSFIVKCGNTQKSSHPPLWQTWNELHPRALIHETMVYVYVCTCNTHLRFLLKYLTTVHHFQDYFLVYIMYRYMTKTCDLDSKSVVPWSYFLTHSNLYKNVLSFTYVSWYAYILLYVNILH